LVLPFTVTLSLHAHNFLPVSRSYIPNGVGNLNPIHRHDPCTEICLHIVIASQQCICGLNF